ncbi:MAG TPA: cation:proton antiporter [Thermomicrobiaceae bacterium]|nr:cation:proton antiporter [Thermomicrobiaceae bacterium]
MDLTQQFVVSATTILVVAALGQVLAQRTPIPSILIYLASGVVLGPTVLNLIATDQMGAMLPAVVRLSVAIIVFEGAFSLEGHYLRQVQSPVRNLVTLGVAVTALAGTLVAHEIAGLSWPLAIQYAALVSVTGPTVITPLLQRVRVRGRVRATLAGEAVIVDPIGAVFAVVVFDLVRSRQLNFVHPVIQVVERLAVGALWGAVAGFLLYLALRQLGDQPSQVARIVAVAGAAAIYAVIESLLPDSGLAAVVVAGLLLGNLDFPHREEVHRFKGDVTMIVIATVYLLLAATLHPGDLLALGWRGPVAVLVMMALVRPAAVAVSTLRSALSPRERGFVAAIGPRGVVAASLVTLISLNLATAGVAGATALRGLVFLTIVITIAIQATYAGWLARWLGVVPMDVLIIGGGKVGRMLAEELDEAGEDVTVIERNSDNAERARQLGVHVVFGDGTDPDVLERAGIAQAKAFVATTGSDKDNLLACQLAKTRFGRERLAARVTDPDAVPSFESLGIQVMNPARATAMILANLVRRPTLFRLLSEVDTEGADITEVVVGTDGAARRELRELALPQDVLVLLVRRGGRHVIPHGDTVLQTGDIVTLVGRRAAADRAARVLQGTG